MGWRLEMGGSETLRNYRVRPTAQLRRYGTNVAKWQNQLLHALQFQWVGRGKKTTLDNLYVITVTRTFGTHGANRA
jgi:hypothetical protein